MESVLNKKLFLQAKKKIEKAFFCAYYFKSKTEVKDPRVNYRNAKLCDFFSG